MMRPATSPHSPSSGLPALLSTRPVDAVVNRHFAQLPSGRLRVDLTTPSERHRSASSKKRRARPHTSPQLQPRGLPIGVSAEENEFGPPRSNTFSSDDDDDDDQHGAVACAATLQERILEAKVRELEMELSRVRKEREGLVSSLKTSITSHEATKARLASVTELLASTSCRSPLDRRREEQQQQQQLCRCVDRATQAPDLEEEAEFAARLESRAGLYAQRDVRAALLTLLDRHDDVKDLLRKHAWLQRNEDCTVRFPYDTRSAALQRAPPKPPATADAIVSARDMTQSQLRGELRELAKRANPTTRFRR